MLFVFTPDAYLLCKQMCKSYCSIRKIERRKTILTWVLGTIVSIIFYISIFYIYEFYIMLPQRRNRSSPRYRGQSCTSLCDLEDQAFPCPQSFWAHCSCTSARRVAQFDRTGGHVFPKVTTQLSHGDFFEGYVVLIALTAQYLCPLRSWVSMQNHSHCGKASTRKISVNRDNYCILQILFRVKKDHYYLDELREEKFKVRKLDCLLQVFRSTSVSIQDSMQAASLYCNYRESQLFKSFVGLCPSQPTLVNNNLPFCKNVQVFNVPTVFADYSQNHKH